MTYPSEIDEHIEQQFTPERVFGQDGLPHRWRVERPSPDSCYR
jgi:hypothetical protein